MLSRAEVSFGISRIPNSPQRSCDYTVVEMMEVTWDGFIHRQVASEPAINSSTGFARSPTVTDLEVDPYQHYANFNWNAWIWLVSDGVRGVFHATKIATYSEQYSRNMMEAGSQLLLTSCQLPHLKMEDVGSRTANFAKNDCILSLSDHPKENPIERCIGAPWQVVVEFA